MISFSKVLTRIISIPVSIIFGLILIISLSYVNLIRGSGINFEFEEFIFIIMMIPAIILVNIPTYLSVIFLSKLDFYKKRMWILVPFMTTLSYVIPWWSLSIGYDLRPVVGTITGFTVLNMVEKSQNKKVIISILSLFVICPILLKIFPYYTKQAFPRFIENPKNPMLDFNKKPILFTCKNKKEKMEFLVYENGEMINRITIKNPVGTMGKNLYDEVKKQGFSVRKCNNNIYYSNISRNMNTLRADIVWEEDERGLIKKIGAYYIRGNIINL